MNQQQILNYLKQNQNKKYYPIQIIEKLKLPKNSNTRKFRQLWKYGFINRETKKDQYNQLRHRYWYEE